MPGHWGGHYEGCREPVGSNAPHGVTFNPEDVIGPDGHPMWAVTCSFHRLNTPDGTHVETVHVRADSYDGAILLARELFPEAMIDAEAQQITERMA